MYILDSNNIALVNTQLTWIAKIGNFNPIPNATLQTSTTSRVSTLQKTEETKTDKCGGVNSGLFEKVG